MKKQIWIRILSLLIVLATLFSVFAACEANSEDKNDDKKDNNDNLANESGSEEVTAEPVPENIKKTNYDDEFYMSIMTDVNPMKYFWVEESKGDAMSEAIYERQQKVYNYIGVDIKAKGAGSYTTYTDSFKTAVKNKDGSVDTLLTHVNMGISSMIVEQYLQDFQDIPGIDLDKDYWNHDFMDANSIADCYYLGFSDYNILYTYVIAFNKKMLNQLALDTFSEEELYESVYNGTWTLDRFLELGQKGFQEKGDKDIYGLVGQQWVPWCGFFHSSNINLVEMNEKGEYELSFYNDANKEKTANLVDKLKNFSASGYGEFIKGTSSPEAKLTNGRALMHIAATHWLEDYLNYEISFGVLPYPLYDEYQFDSSIPSLGYRSLQWGGQIVIPSYLRNTQMVGETLELLAFYSDNVQTTFYEKLLGKQVSEAPDDAKVLDIVWNGICGDIGQTFNDEAGVLYFLPEVTWPGEGGKQLASYYASKEKAANKKLNAFIKKVNKLNEN